MPMSAFIKVNSAPWIFSYPTDEYDEIYVIAYKGIDKELKLEGMIAKEFHGKTVQIAHDVSLRAFYIFVKG